MSRDEDGLVGVDEDPVVRRILTMFEAWGESYEAMCRSVFETFGAECIWENPGLPATTGPHDAVERCIQATRQSSGLESIKVVVHHISRVGRFVWTERTDDLLRTDGSLILSCGVAGVMEVGCDGQINAWREYSRRT